MDIENILLQNPKEISKKIEEHHPEDIAKILKNLFLENNSEFAFKIFINLKTSKASEVLYELDEDILKDIIDKIDLGRMSLLIDAMPTDEATDIVSSMSKQDADEVIKNLKKEKRDTLKNLLTYPEDTAGGLMDCEYVAIFDTDTVEDGIKRIRHSIKKLKNIAGEKEKIHYLFVINKEQKLVGIVSLPDFVTSEPDVQIFKIMNKEVIKVNTDLDQEEVVNIFSKYDIYSMPVVDKNGVLVGRISIDDVIDVVQEEATEDMFKMAGIEEENEYQSHQSIFHSIKIRIPWLLVSICGELLSAFILKSYSIVMAKVIAISFFIPLIMALGGNVGTQSAIIMVRGISLGEIDMKKINRLIFNEIFVGILLGIICSIVVGFMAYLLNYADTYFIFVVAISMTIAMTISASIGIILPLIFHRLKIDPAAATGPFITTSNDVLGLFIYISIVIFMIKP